MSTGQINCPDHDKPLEVCGLKCIDRLQRKAIYSRKLIHWIIHHQPESDRMVEGIKEQIEMNKMFWPDEVCQRCQGSGVRPSPFGDVECFACQGGKIGRIEEKADER